jgi:hypothetical protein
MGIPDRLSRFLDMSGIVNVDRRHVKYEFLMIDVHNEKVTARLTPQSDLIYQCGDRRHYNRDHTSIQRYVRNELGHTTSPSPGSTGLTIDSTKCSPANMAG